MGLVVAEGTVVHGIPAEGGLPVGEGSDRDESLQHGGLEFGGANPVAVGGDGRSNGR